MAANLAWDPAFTAPVLVFMTAAVTYVAYHYGAHASVFAKRLQAGDDDRVQAQSVHLQRLAGALILGLVPTAVVLLALPLSPADLGLAAPDLTITAAFVAGTAVLALPVVAAAASKPRQWTAYPQIRAQTWDRQLYVHNAVTWAVYLLGYEIFFRGFLLGALIPSLGVWPAITASTALYVYAHLPKPAAETAGTVLMGVVFCVAALLSGGVWAPLLMHLLIAVTSDVVATRANPAITVRR